MSADLLLGLLIWALLLLLGWAVCRMADGGGREDGDDRPAEPGSYGMNRPAQPGSYSGSAALLRDGLAGGDHHGVGNGI